MALAMPFSLITASSFEIVETPRKRYRAERWTHKFPVGRAIQMRCKCEVSRRFLLDSTISPPTTFSLGTHPAFRPCGKDYLSNLPGELRNMVYREVLDSFTFARLRCPKCRLSHASKERLKICTGWFMVNRVIYAEASSLFLTAYLPNMGVHLNSLQELSDCIDVFGDRCPGLLVSLTQFHTSLAPDTKPFRDAVMSKLLCMGLDEPSLENGQAGMRWVDCSTSSERAKDEAIVYTMFTSDLYLAPSVFRVYPALFIRGNVGRAPWLRQILEDPMLRRDMGMTRIPGTKLWLQVRPY